MVTAQDAMAMALSLDGTEQQPHFNRIAFKIKKKIFATLSFEENTLNLMFTPTEQLVFCPPGSDVIFPVPNGWGKRGATTINLKKATTKLVMQALKEAYAIRLKK